MAEALRLGINRRALYAMRDANIIEALSRGLFRLSEMQLGYPDLVTVASRVKEGVICLVTALAHHELTTHIPHVIDVALERGTRKPLMEHPPTRFYWFSGPAFTEGIETHKLDDTSVRIYDPEKTITDCFRFRRQLGMDIVLEALRLWRESRRKKLDVLVKYARLRNVEKAMRPYLEL